MATTDAVGSDAAAVEPDGTPDAGSAPVVPELHADCTRCFALCCIAPAFEKSADFAIEKRAGHECPNLQQEDFRCSLHRDLRQHGFRGCTVYDCFGAGQQVAQVTFDGRDWRQDPASARQMFAVFGVMRQLHELLWFLSEATQLVAELATRSNGVPVNQPYVAAQPPDITELRRELATMLAATTALTIATADALVELDVDAQRRKANALLQRTSDAVRLAYRSDAPDHRGADLIEADLNGADLRYACFRGAFLIGANLSNADLRGCDLTGADFRDTNLCGADLTGCIFLLQSQLDSARGNGATQLPPTHRRPAHWPSSG